jgi:4-amino-4-deoxy-L-arabinose transferase-like glycosyltransferase
LQIPPKLRVALGTLIFLFIVFHCFFTGLSTVGFVGPDEPRYASIAREMARSGDWVTPRLNGSPWFEKPPLYYWSAAIGFQIFKSPEVAARAPSGVVALLAVLGLMMCAKRLYGSATAFAVGVMLPATVGMTGFARAAATDMPFAACLTLAMSAAAYLLLEESPAHTRATFGAFGVALALAVLAKGPAAILLAGGSVALWAVATGNIRRSFRLFHPVATLSFIAVALPWYALCAARNPEFLRIFLLEHNVERFLTNRYQHQQPFWFFLPILLLAVFPWTLLLVPALADAWRAFRNAAWRKSPNVFFAAWVLFPFVFFSASQSKLPGYILPAVPPLILLLARAVAGEEAAPRPRPLWTALLLSVAGVAALLMYYFPAGVSKRWLADLPGLREDEALLFQLFALVLLGGGILAGGLSFPRSLRRSVAAASIVYSIAVGFAANHLLPVFGPDISPREVAFAARGPAGSGLITVYELPRTWQYGAEFYLDRALPEWTPAIRPPTWVITTELGREKLSRFRASVFPTGVKYGRVILVGIE